MEIHSIESPLGALVVTIHGGAVTSLRFAAVPQAGDFAPSGEGPKSDSFRFVRDQLAAYFRGEIRQFEVPIKLDGTPFQRRVWLELMTVPYGVSISYGELAERIGCPGGSRAVGQANHRNPIAILVPCHRVIGGDGSLTGYGGGLDRKRWLLEHEAKNLARQPEWQFRRSRTGARLEPRSQQRSFPFSLPQVRKPDERPNT